MRCFVDWPNTKVALIPRNVTRVELTVN